MNTVGPTISDLAGPGRKPQVLPATGTAATGTIMTGGLVAAPGAGKRIVVVGLCVSTAGAVGTGVSLKAGSTVLWQAFVTSSAPVPDNPANGQPVCVVPANTQLDFRNDAAGTSAINLRYIIEAVV